MELAQLPEDRAIGRPARVIRGTVRFGGPTIALCMIVRDEAAVIGRCIESVRSLIDCWGL